MLGAFSSDTNTGCGSQHPPRFACVLLAAAPTAPPCFRHWRRSLLLQAIPSPALLPFGQQDPTPADGPRRNSQHTSVERAGFIYRFYMETMQALC